MRERGRVKHESDAEWPSALLGRLNGYNWVFRETCRCVCLCVCMCVCVCVCVCVCACVCLCLWRDVGVGGEERPRGAGNISCVTLSYFSCQVAGWGRFSEWVCVYVCVCGCVCWCVWGVVGVCLHYACVVCL